MEEAKRARPERVPEEMAKEEHEAWAAAAVQAAAAAAKLAARARRWAACKTTVSGRPPIADADDECRQCGRPAFSADLRRSEVGLLSCQDCLEEEAGW